MKCPHHSRNEVVGYCSVCGAFGCQECIHDHEGELYCEKHFRPIAKKIEEEKKRETKRKRHARQRLVVRYKDGHVLRGVCYALNIRDTGFHLDIVDDEENVTNKTEQVRFSDIKAVFYVKSFDGKFDRHHRYAEWTPQGSEIVVEFEDGEVVRGFSLHSHDESSDRFHLIPKEQSGNNISVLVERSAVAGVYSPEEYKRKIEEQRQAQKKVAGSESVDLSQEETMGDFYFETRNYDAALEQYRIAAHNFPASGRIKKKIVLATYNVGVQHIKRHQYEQALEAMEKVLEMDAHNHHATKKIIQLKRILDKQKLQAQRQEEARHSEKGQQDVF